MRHRVQFTAHEKVKEPAVIKFETKNGPVQFQGHKDATEAVRVSFLAENK